MNRFEANSIRIQENCNRVMTAIAKDVVNMINCKVEFKFYDKQGHSTYVWWQGVTKENGYVQYNNPYLFDNTHWMAWLEQTKRYILDYPLTKIVQPGYDREATYGIQGS